MLRFSSSYILDRRYFFSITCSLHSLSLLVVKFCTQEESDEGGILHGAIYEVIRDFEQVKWGWLQGKKVFHYGSGHAGIVLVAVVRI